jgi:hypothetical protein
VEPLHNFRLSFFVLVNPIEHLYEHVNLERFESQLRDDSCNFSIGLRTQQDGSGEIVELIRF